jgi:truncated hemoglobin YjbI
MVDVKKQRIWIKFCFKLNKTAAETHRMLKEAFGEQDLNQARTFEWFKCFKDAWNPWTNINILVNHPHAELWK